MIRRLIPRLDLGRWGGGSIDGEAGLDGVSIAAEWLGIHVEIALARRTRRR